MKVLKSIEQVIFETPVRKLVLFTAALILLKVGVWYIPNFGMIEVMAKNPFANSFNPNEQYMFWSWLGPFLAWLIHARERESLFLFHLAFSVAFFLLYVKVVFSTLPDALARSSLILFTLLPVSATAFFWVSMDSLTLFLMLLALAYPGHAFVTLLIGIALGMQHFEGAFLAATCLLVALTLSKIKFNDSYRYSVKFAGLLCAGTIAGKLLLISLFKHYGIQVSSGRTDWLKSHLPQLLSEFFFHTQYILWSILGLGWLAAIKYSDIGRRSIPFFVSFVGALLLLPVSEDQTRVLCIVSFPLIMTYWLLNEDFLKTISRQEASFASLLWVVMPWAWVWAGVPRWSVFPYDLTLLANKLFDWFAVPSDPLWPFK